jgi:Family of unknown function (DUF6308)
MVALSRISAAARRPNAASRAMPGVLAARLMAASGGPITAGKLLARKRPHLIPVYDNRVRDVLGRPRPDNSWWRDLWCQLVNDQSLAAHLRAVRSRAGADHMSLLRVFDVMCWMFSWPGEVTACS